MKALSILLLMLWYFFVFFGLFAMFVMLGKTTDKFFFLLFPFVIFQLKKMVVQTNHLVYKECYA